MSASRKQSTLWQWFKVNIEPLPTSEILKLLEDARDGNPDHRGSDLSLLQEAQERCHDGAVMLAFMGRAALYNAHRHWYVAFPLAIGLMVCSYFVTRHHRRLSRARVAFERFAPTSLDELAAREPSPPPGAASLRNV